MPTRREALLTVAGTVSIAGCTQNGIIERGGTTTPDYRTVSVENRRNESVEIEITVNDSRAEEILHTETYTLDPEEEKLVYNTSSDDLGATMLEVTAKPDSNSITELNSGCDGYLPIIIESDGSLNGYNSVC